MERAGQGRSVVTSLASLGSLSLPPLACTAPGSLADKRVSYLGCLLVGASLLGLPHPQPCSGALGAGWRVPSPAGAWSAGTSCAGDQLGPLLGSAGCPYLSWPLPRVPWPCGTQSESSSLAVFLQKASRKQVCGADERASCPSAASSACGVCRAPVVKGPLSGDAEPLFIPKPGA